MVALATTEDLEAVSGVEVGDIDRANRLVEMASAAVERWCNRSFAFIADDEVIVHVDGGVMRLPNGPIASVTSIAGPAAPWLPAPSVVDAAGYAVVQEHVVRQHGQWGCGDYTVVYSHGYDPIPGAVVLAVCQIVNRKLNGSGGLERESIGEAAFGYHDEWASGNLVVGDGERSLLAPYRRTVSSVPVVR